MALGCPETASSPSGPFLISAFSLSEFQLLPFQLSAFPVLSCGNQCHVSRITFHSPFQLFFRSELPTTRSVPVPTSGFDLFPHGSGALDVSTQWPV